MVIALLPVPINFYHVATGALPASGSQYIESGVSVILAGLFYYYSKKWMNEEVEMSADWRMSLQIKYYES